MILSCSTITWGQLNGMKDLEKALASIKALGYSDAGIEYPMLSASLKEHVKEGGAAAKKAGLTVAAVAIDTTPAMAKVVKGFGSSVGWLCLFEKDIDVAIEKTKKLSAVCAKVGVDVSLHPHVRSNIQSTDDLDRIMKACAPNRTSVCVDTAHLTALDVDIPKFISRYKKSISLVHLKDLSEKKPQEEIDYNKHFVDLGDGVADLKGALKALRAMRYSGAIMIEVDNPPKGMVEASAKKNHGYLTSIVR
jgi:sugar phosphate isomerase/epimerase